MPNSHDDHERDEALLAELSEHFARHDPVPRHVVDAARVAIEFRDLDGQLAELLRDSALEDKELAGVRGVGQRLLTFGVGDRFVEVDVASDAEERAMSGYVVPAEAGTVLVEHRDGVAESPVDEHGRFRLTRIPRGPIRMRVQLPGRSALITQWLAI